MKIGPLHIPREATIMGGVWTTGTARLWYLKLCGQRHKKLKTYIHQMNVAARREDYGRAAFWRDKAREMREIMDTDRKCYEGLIARLTKDKE